MVEGLLEAYLDDLTDEIKILSITVIFGGLGPKNPIWAFWGILTHFSYFDHNWLRERLQLEIVEFYD